MRASQVNLADPLKHIPIAKEMLGESIHLLRPIALSDFNLYEFQQLVSIYVITCTFRATSAPRVHSQEGGEGGDDALHRVLRK